MATTDTRDQPGRDDLPRDSSGDAGDGGQVPSTGDVFPVEGTVRVLDPVRLVLRIEELLATRHRAPVSRWDPLSDDLLAVEQQLLALPAPQLQEATHVLLTLLHQVVENEGLEVGE